MALPDAGPGRRAPRRVGSVSVVMPAADEAANLPTLMERLETVLAEVATRHEVVVVVPTPEDPSGDAARAHGARVLVQRRPGYGGALREGLAAARGDWVVTLDADHSHPPEDVPALLAAREGADVVVASRYVPGAAADQGPGRILLSRLLNAVTARALRLPLRDTSSGFRLYRREVLRGISLRGERYDVLQEILVSLYCQGRQIREVPFHYRPRHAGRTHARPLRFLPHFLATLFRLFLLRNRLSAADYEARAYDSILPPQRLWQRRRHHILRRLSPPSGRCLDLGCGSSHLVASRPEVVALDLEMAKLRYLGPGHRRRVRARAQALPLADESLDGVVAAQLLEHVAEDPVLLREMARVLRPGGTLVVETPDYDRWQWRLIEWGYRRVMPTAFSDEHPTHYTRSRLLDELAGAGFAIVHTEYLAGGELFVQAVKREEPC